jgi:ABC-type sugar transport system ATPase subunit
MSSVTKRFGPVTVLRGVEFEIWPGEVHVLAGENGAGKSTLIKILGGVHPDFDGDLQIQGRSVRPQSPTEAAALGVSVIHQELSLVGPMSVSDNIFLGQMDTRYGWVRDRRQHRASAELLTELGVQIDVRRSVEEYPMAIRQLIEIAKALGRRTKVIVMDEPTSALNEPEVRRLFALIDHLKQQGCGIVYITHKMDEIERVADRITVLRDGVRVGSAPASDLTSAELIRWMVGRTLGEQIPRHTPRLGAERLRLEQFGVHPPGMSGRAAVQGVNLSVRAGEIVGIGGLQGSGASDLLLGLFGAYGDAIRGRAYLEDQPLRIGLPRDAIDAGIALLTNDRKATGLVLSLSIVANSTLVGLNQLSPGGWRRPRLESAATEAVTRSLQLRAASLELEVGALSGGNQQKVAIAKWLQVRPRLLLLDEPTRGIDIGAKHEIYSLMNHWTDQGIAILLITSEMPELLALSDRVVVLHRGRVTAEFDRQSATPEAVLSAAMGTDSNA